MSVCGWVVWQTLGLAGSSRDEEEVEDGDGLVVVAPKGGSDRPPAW